MKNQVTLTESEIRLYNMYKNFDIKTGATELDAHENALRKIVNSRIISAEMKKIGFTY